MAKKRARRSARAQEKRAQAPVGNLPVRLEHWLLPRSGVDLLRRRHQPRERFVRVEDGAITRLTCATPPMARLPCSHPRSRPS